jgi:hypothetical protein
MFPVEKLETSNYKRAMETQLANHLLTLSELFCDARQLGESTVGRHCAADGRFFSRIREGKTFTAKKYDEVVAWFSENWPQDITWPSSVPRPQICEAAP